MVYPWLATSYKWSAGGKTLTFDLAHGVDWSDGVPFTSSDVAYTFDLLKRYPAFNTNQITFTSIATPTPYEVVMRFATPQFVNLYYIAGQFIVPQHIWSKVRNPITYLNTDPIGTGPFLLQSYSPENVGMVRNAHFRIKDEPYVKSVQLPVFESNTTGDLAISEGKISWGAMFDPGVQKSFVDKAPQYNNFWSPGLDDIFLTPNLAQYPLNQLVLRQAISDAIDRKTILKISELYQDPYLGTPTGLLLPTQQSFMAPEYKNLQYQVSSQKANALLDKAGYKMGSNGIRRDPHGSPLSFTFEVPSSFTNWMSDGQVMAQELGR